MCSSNLGSNMSSDDLPNVENILHNFVANPVDEIRSKEAFLKRLSTFNIVKWNGKPKEISPLECAKHGWTNSEVDLLKCTSCNEFLGAKLPKLFQLELYKRSSEELGRNIRDKHHKMCPWKSNPSPESYTDVGLWTKDEIEVEFKSRLDSLVSLKEFLPELEDENESEISSFLDKFKSQRVNFDFDLSTVQLALRGWESKCKITDKNITLHCKYCVRDVGVWMFTNPNSENGLPLKKKIKLEIKNPTNKFNPVKDHHDWCTWVVKSSSANLEGWRCAMRVLSQRGKTRQNGKELPKLSVVRKWLDA